MDIDNDDGSSSEMGEEELENMVRQAEQNGTVRQTKWVVKKFEDWTTKRKVVVNMSDVEPGGGGVQSYMAAWAWLSLLAHRIPC